jgi:hypothetical protein
MNAPAHLRIANRDHEARVMALRQRLCDIDPLAIHKLRLRAKWVREYGGVR